MAVLSTLLTLSVITLISSSANAQTSDLVTYPTPIGTQTIDGSTYLIRSIAAPEATQSGGFQCPLKPVQADDQSLEYAYNIQTLLYNYYEAQDLSAASFGDLESDSGDGNFNAADVAANLQGLRTQADLGRRAINQLGGMTAGYQTTVPAQCNYTYPAGLGGTTSVETFLENAFMVEATLCGAFIGLADYVELPQSAALMARLAAEHALHAAYLRSFFAAPVLFMADSSSLTPAFTPEMVLSDSPTTYPFTVGYLGQFLSGTCKAVMPAGPCGATVTFGELLPVLAYGADITTVVATATETAASATEYPVATATTTDTTRIASVYSTVTAVYPPVETITTSTYSYDTTTSTVTAAVTAYTGAGEMLQAPGKRLAAVAAAGAGLVRRMVGGE